MKLNAYEITHEIHKAAEQWPIGSMAMHYKGGMYIILGYVFDTTLGAVLIRYRRIHGPDFDSIAERLVEFARPVEEFSQRTDTGVARFSRRF